MDSRNKLHRLGCELGVAGETTSMTTYHLGATPCSQTGDSALLFVRETGLRVSRLGSADSQGWRTTAGRTSACLPVLGAQRQNFANSKPGYGRWIGERQSSRFRRKHQIEVRGRCNEKGRQPEGASGPEVKSS